MSDEQKNNETVKNPDEAKRKNKERTKKLIYICLGLLLVCGIVGNLINPNTKTKTLDTNTNRPEYDMEMTMEQIFNEFSDKSDIQISEKIKEYKGKRIKTSIYVSKINQASLSSQYVILWMYEYPYNLLPYAKAFFPAEQKNNLLKANVGNTVIFSGEFVTYKGGTSPYVEFTNSRLISIEET